MIAGEKIVVLTSRSDLLAVAIVSIELAQFNKAGVVIPIKKLLIVF